LNYKSGFFLSLISLKHCKMNHERGDPARRYGNPYSGGGNQHRGGGYHQGGGYHNNRRNWHGGNNWNRKKYQTFERRQNRNYGSGYDFSRGNSQAERERSTIPDPDRERKLFGALNDSNQGINFERYDDIPVEMSGEECPHPINDFSTSMLSEVLLANVNRSKFLKPTPVQKYSIPIVLDGRDLMACAQTGSGKTAAFLLPSLHNLLKSVQPSLLSGRNPVFTPSCLVLAPTRELAQQTHLQAQRFLYLSGMRSCVIYGGAHINSQFHQMNGGVDVLVATPGRLYDMYDRQRLSLANVRILIMDEADRMLDMGFEPQIRQIVEECDMPPSNSEFRQTLMYSATFPLEIQKLAQDFLNNYIFLAVGRVGSTTDFIKQEVEYVPDWAKPGKLLEFLPQFDGQRTLVFTQTKKGADELERFLTNQNFSCMVIHGDKNQRDRERALNQFRRGYIHILIATDVAARGLDIPDVKAVVQFDCPSHIDDYVHRIGRTGRCGNTGYALTFVNEGSRPILIDLANIIKESNQEVPQWYINMCGVVLHNNKKRGRFGGRDIRRGTGRDKNFGRKRQGGNNRHNHKHGRNNHNYRQNNYNGGSGGGPKHNYGGRPQNQHQQFGNVRQFQEPQAPPQQQPQGHPQSLQNYPAYNYTPTPQTGFVGYPVTKIQLDAGGTHYQPQNMAPYVPSPKNAANMEFHPGTNANPGPRYPSQVG